MNDWTGNKAKGSAKPRRTGTTSGKPSKSSSKKTKKVTGRSAAKQY